MLTKMRIEEYLKPLAPIETGIAAAGTRLTSIRAVLFDIYGTLFISAAGDLDDRRRRPGDPAAMKRLLSRFGISRSYGDLLGALHARIDESHLKKRVQGIDHPEIEIDRIWMEILGWNDPQRAREFSFRFELITNPVYPMPDLQPTLAELQNRRVCMGLISNAQFYTPYLFELFLGADLLHLGFDEALTFFSFRLGISKPSEFLFERASERLMQMRIPSEQVLYMGNDMRNDILPARNVGFRTALFAGDRRSLRLREDLPECAAIVPDLVITKLRQLPDYLGR